MAERRVVVTGMGALACNGAGVPAFNEALKAGRQGIGSITRFDTATFGTKFGGEVKLTNEELAGDGKIARRKDRFVLLALKAAAEAMAMSGLNHKAWADPYRVGVIIGAGIGGLGTIETEMQVMLQRGPHRVSPFMIPRMIVDSAAGDVSIVYGAKGPNFCITTACATATHCIGAALQYIRAGICDVVITGGTESSITPLGVAGFNSIKALSTRNESPETACRPFDKDRDGFVMAEGCGILVLESEEHARKRGAVIFGEIAGYACTGDAYHETAPDPSGEAGAMAMRLALKDAGVSPEQITYVNAHGTSTPLNDASETRILKMVFGEHARKFAVSSTKGMTGHTLGAAGAVEAVACILAMRDGYLPPTINYTTPDPDCDLDYVPNQTRAAQTEFCLSNNLGFGGHNATLILKRWAG
jgi:3-oxoacyl-[acyl-carrier-protein] synthase II